MVWKTNRVGEKVASFQETHWKWWWWRTNKKVCIWFLIVFLLVRFWNIVSLKDALVWFVFVIQFYFSFLGVYIILKGVWTHSSEKNHKISVRLSYWRWLTAAEQSVINGFFFFFVFFITLYVDDWCDHWKSAQQELSTRKMEEVCLTLYLNIQCACVRVFVYIFVCFFFFPVYVEMEKTRENMHEYCQADTLSIQL
jgi:hypothetical protein